MKHFLFFKIFFAFAGYIMFETTRSIQAQALDFDGSDDFVTMNAVANEMAGQVNFTLECWVKIDSLYQTLQGGIMAVHTSTGGNLFIIFAGGTGSNNQLSIYDGVTPGGYEIVGGKVADHTWHHIAYVRTGSTGEAFLDGVSQGTHTPNFSLSAADQWSLGQEWDGATHSNHLRGIIDEVRIWKVARTITQIQQDMHKELCLFPASLVAYYNLNQGIPYGLNFNEDTIFDKSTSNNIALPLNFSLAGPKSNWSVGANIGSGSSTDLTACKFFTGPSGKYTWTTSGVYTDTLPNKDFCDSIITIDLIVNTVNTQIIQVGSTFTAIETGAGYQWLDCDDNYSPISGESHQAFTPVKSGNYALWIVKDDCADTSACYGISLGMTERFLQENTVISPNPSASTFTIDLKDFHRQIDWEVVDITGTIVLQHHEPATSRFELNLKVPAGIYFLMLRSEDERAAFKLVRE